jgi:hypothetical protein
MIFEVVDRKFTVVFRKFTECFTPVGGVTALQEALRIYGFVKPIYG